MGITIDTKAFASDFWYRGSYNDEIKDYEFIIRDGDGEDLEITWEVDPPEDSESIELGIMQDFKSR